MTKAINIILLGDPAAGKATQSAMLVARYKLYDFDMGKELRLLRNRDKTIDERLKGNNDKGKLTPTDIVRSILRQKVISLPPNRGILFDGHPKMLGEAKLVTQLLKEQRRQDPIVVYLSIPYEEMVKRMHDRQGYFKGKFGKRADDTDAALKNRMRYYRHNIAQVIEYFKARYPYYKVSGLGTEAEVSRQLNGVIAKIVN